MKTAVLADYKTVSI